MTNKCIDEIREALDTDKTTRNYLMSLEIRLLSIKKNIIVLLPS